MPFIHRQRREGPHVSLVLTTLLGRLISGSSDPLPISGELRVRIKDARRKHAEEASVYIHWPYCSQLCSYCAFVKYVPKPGKPWTLDDDKLESAMVGGY